VNLEDRQRIDDCLAGNKDAFGHLVLKYQDRLFNSVVRIVDSHEDAADAVQDAFINAYQSLASFKGDAEFYTWLYRIAFNTAVSLKRKRKQLISLESRRDTDQSLDPMDHSEETRPGVLMERREDEVVLQAALNRLSAEHRTVLVLKDIDGLKYEEIAEVMKVPIGTIRSRIHRARLELKELLEPEFGNQPPEGAS
jgi:RNA polymerase sigma-70 factor, ECF subfamily